MREYEQHEYTHGTDINWYANEWFVKYHVDNLTSDFAKWWLETYDPIDDRDSEYYWVRCAFALVGFIAGSQKS